MTEMGNMEPDTGRVQRRRIALTVAVGSMLVIAWMMQSFAAGPVWLAGALGALAAVIGGYPIASKAIRAARHRQLSVDALVAIAAVAAITTRAVPFL